MYVCIEVTLCGDVHGIGRSNWAKGRDPSGSWVQHPNHAVPSAPRLQISLYPNLAWFQSKLNLEIDPSCRLCLQANKTLYHLMTDCEATNSLQMNIMKNQIPLPGQ